MTQQRNNARSSEQKEHLEKARLEYEAFQANVRVDGNEK
jgi:hypothetical protein